MSDVAHLLGVLAAIFVATTLLGALAQRLRQPAVLGEVVAGVLLGGSVLGVVDARDPAIHAMAEIGVVVLLFETGLHVDFRSLLNVGSVATAVGLVGVVVPFALGYASALAFGLSQVPALVCGAALCATSVGISARVLSDLGQLDSPEGRVVLGAAVLDDVVGLIVLSIITAVVAGMGVTLGSMTRITLVAVAFVVVAVVVGMMVAQPVFGLIERVKSSGTMGLLGLSFAFVLALLAQLSGSALIIGAFAAGLVLFRTPQRQEIEKATTTIGHFFVPIFFASVGAEVDLRALANPHSLVVGAVLIACGVSGKIIAGYAPVWFPGRKLLIGVAMVPRGEVGLVFAQLGLSTGAIDDGLFGALMVMILTTTLMAPPLLEYLARRTPSGMFAAPAVPDDRPGEGGIDDLVAGTRQSDPSEQVRSTKVIRRR